MKLEKQPYETPTTDIVDVKLHGILCQSGFGLLYNPEDYDDGGDPLAD